MKTLANLLMLIFGLIWAISIGIGFDLKRHVSWLYVLCGFLSGLSLGIYGDNMVQGIKVGVLLTLLSFWGGPIMFNRRQQNKE